MRRFWIGLALLVFLVREARAAEPVSVEIALPRQQNFVEVGPNSPQIFFRDILSNLSKDAKIPVLVRNLSKKPVRVSTVDGWWKNENLSFRLDVGGKSYPIRRPEHPKDEVLYVRYWLLQPGGSMVLNVDLNDGSWVILQALLALRSGPGVLVPIYGEKADPAAKQDPAWAGHVWSGRVEGPGIQVAY